MTQVLDYNKYINININNKYINILWKYIVNYYNTLHALHERKINDDHVSSKQGLEKVQKSELETFSAENASDNVELKAIEKLKEKLCSKFARKASKHSKYRNIFLFSEKLSFDLYLILPYYIIVTLVNKT